MELGPGQEGASRDGGGGTLSPSLARTTGMDRSVRRQSARRALLGASVPSSPRGTTGDGALS